MGECLVIGAGATSRGVQEQDMPLVEIGIQIFNKGGVVILTLGIPFSVSTCIHYCENFISVLNREPNRDRPDSCIS